MPYFSRGWRLHILSCCGLLIWHVVYFHVGFLHDSFSKCDFYTMLLFWHGIVIWYATAIAPPPPHPQLCNFNVIGYLFICLFVLHTPQLCYFFNMMLLIIAVINAYCLHDVRALHAKMHFHMLSHKLFIWTCEMYVICTPLRL